jgi:hypothetical protein
MSWQLVPRPKPHESCPHPSILFIYGYFDTILCLCIELPSGFVLSGLSIEILNAFIFIPMHGYLSCLSSLLSFDHPNNILQGVEIIKALIMQFFHTMPS